MVVCVLGMAGGSAMAKTPRVVNPGGADRGVVDDTPYYGGFGPAFSTSTPTAPTAAARSARAIWACGSMGRRSVVPTGSSSTCGMPRGNGTATWLPARAQACRWNTCRSSPSVSTRSSTRPCRWT